jgi:nicotinamide-nucleotide amidase
LRICLISTGEEILRGEVLDTNGAQAARLLDEHGFHLSKRITCGDQLGDLVNSFRQGLAHTDALIACGGLGPTLDDRTAEALAQMLGCELVEDSCIVSKLKQKFQAFGAEFTDNQKRQARIPQGGQAIDNPNGTAVGIQVEKDKQWLFCLPGPPREFLPMLKDAVLPKLLRIQQAQHTPDQVVARVFKTFGQGEGWVAQQLNNLPSLFEHLELGYRAHGPEVHVKLRLRQSNLDAAKKTMEEVIQTLKTRLGPLVFAEGDQSLAQVTIEKLIQQGLTLSAAESCTGGWIGKLLTDVPGSSDTFLLSAVTYNNQAKQAILGVDAGILKKHGAASQACAMAMAEGAKRISGSDCSVSVTGIAGPGGGSQNKPVGTVFFGLCTPEGTQIKKRTFPNMGRDLIRQASAHTAIDLIRRHT